MVWSNFLSILNIDCPLERDPKATVFVWLSQPSNLFDDDENIEIELWKGQHFKTCEVFAIESYNNGEFWTNHPFPLDS